MRIVAGQFLMALSLGFSLGASASDWCTRAERVDIEVPAGLTGRYELIGRDAASGAAYAGELLIAGGTRSYALRRSVKGRVVKGEAWIERCGPDRIPGLHARYATSPRALELRCAFGNDGDNYYRLSCITHYAGTRDTARGLEAMFQRQ